jgi:hypothetical protein
MDRRDYILRVIEQAGQILIALRQLIVARVAGDAEVEDRLRTAAAHAGLDLDLARLTTAETLALLTAPTGDVEPGRCWLYAETLYLDGLHAHLQARPAEAIASYRKARLLFSMVEPWGGQLVGWPEAAERIAEIDCRLQDLDEDPGPDPGPDPGDAPAPPPSRARRARSARRRTVSAIAR